MIPAAWIIKMISETVEKADIASTTVLGCPQTHQQSNRKMEAWGSGFMGKNDAVNAK